MQEANVGDRWMLRLMPGEEILQALAEFAERRGVRAAAVPMGIGQVEDASIGFWNGREYDARVVEAPTELLGLSGSIADSNGAPSVHLHATLGLSDHSTMGGHLLRARVGLLAEVLVETFAGRTFRRPLDPRLGLRLLEVDGAPVG